jgi:hypothetical protein
VDPNRLAAYEEAFLALDAAVEAEQDGDVAQVRRLRNLARLMASFLPVDVVPGDAAPLDLPDGW